MNYCDNYKIKCPYALSDEAPVPCIGTQNQCNVFRKENEKNLKKGKKNV
jgi:hypothetical protein